MAKFTRTSRRCFARMGAGTSLSLAYRLPQAAERLPGAQLSREARQRLKILDYARTHTVAATCRHFGIARSTYYRWAKRYDPQRLSLLENRSSRPTRCRCPSWSPAQVSAVRQARETHPRWGKDKLAVVLRRQGVRLSVSMIGRILRELTRRRLLIEPVLSRLRPHSRHARPYAVRKPKAHPVVAPGDLVQVDTMHLRPLPGVERRHFTAVDVVSRWRWSASAPRPPPAPPAPSWLRSRPGARSPSARSRSMAAVSSWPILRPPVPSAGSRCSCCRPVPPNSTAMSSAPMAPTAASSGSVMTATSTCHHSRRLCAPGRTTTITSAHTRPWATPPPPSSSPRSASPRCSGRTERGQNLDARRHKWYDLVR